MKDVIESPSEGLTEALNPGLALHADLNQSASYYYSHVLTPPYKGVYEWVHADQRFFWWHLVKKPNVGQAVVQLGTRRVRHPYSVPRARGGLKHVYQAKSTGPHDIRIDVSTGPITRKQGARVSALAWVQGVGGTFRSTPVFSYQRTSLLIRDAHLRYGYDYTIVVAGEVWFPAPPDKNPYGEFIGTFPRITITPRYYASGPEEDAEIQNLDQLIAKHDSLEKMCDEIAKGCGDADGSEIHALAEDVSEEQIAATGDAGFVTSTKDAEG